MSAPVSEDYDYVRKCLEDATEYGLQADVVTWAIYWMKLNPELTIQQAMEAGMGEFDV